MFYISSFPVSSIDSPPKRNGYLYWQWKMGFVSLTAQRNLRDCAIGLDELKTCPFPADYVDRFSRMGKATVRDRPPPNPTTAYRPGERWC
jgi:hypothetical protein